MDDPYNSGERVGIDVTVVNTLATSYISEQAAEDALHPLRAAEKKKQKRIIDGEFVTGGGRRSAIRDGDDDDTER